MGYFITLALTLTVYPQEKRSPPLSGIVDSHCKPVYISTINTYSMVVLLKSTYIELEVVNVLIQLPCGFLNGKKKMSQVSKLTCNNSTHSDLRVGIPFLKALEFCE